MFENLTDQFERAFKVLKGQGQITEINVAETLKEVRRALLDADVNFKTAKDFTNRVKEKALGENVLTAISPGQLMIKICHEELVELMGGNESEIQIQGSPGIVLMSGLQGSGKPTFSGTLASYLQNKKNKKPLLVACDVYRPAAIDQLHVLGEQLGIEVYSNKEEKDPVKIATAAIIHAKSNGFNVVIVDTAGRLAIDEAMMDESAKVKAALKPTERLFGVESLTGQDAVNTA
ncbi:MAG: signal recognition particle receptor subunit alpha, partial [Fluviicola sp.]